MAMTPATNRKLRTWSQFGDVKRKPTPYEAVTGKFHYHFRREPAPFEMDPHTPLNLWYLKNREGSAFQVDDWEQFRDPFKLTYRDYVAMQHEREIFVDGMIDRAEASNHAATLSPEWVAALADVLVPLRFPIHVLQMVSLYVGQMAPSSYITNCAHFQAADQMRRIQRIAYWTKVLDNAHGGDIASTERSRQIWESDPAWQPLRKALEELLITYDWGEAFTALNVVLKPTLDAMFNEALSELATQNGDAFVAELAAEFAHDSARSRDWTQALTAYALERDPKLSEVLDGWVQKWTPVADAAVDGFAPVFSKAPVPFNPATVIEKARSTRDEFIVGTSI
ncbi:toluene hydroxylase [Sinomonas cyclohexanicum]|uniref:propane 2-monooxygenase n=1 Tax=Sinomonas cyclohexanicum TaxID=322009 RepID=A0ABN6FCB5_SINCY|nr:aromatic/alkene monooxygenase hydroxylase subunit beta [Corynebacterium cyclohexanicum]BCT74624.1 toluene hydroxylase [Corynebacterium cyclohexanicum]